MIRNILIVILLIAVGYLGFQNYSDRIEIEHLNANIIEAKAQISKLSHHPFKAVESGQTDYLAKAAIHVQRGEDAFSQHDYKLAAREYGYARLALAKAAERDISGQRNAVSDFGKRAAHLADQIKQLGDAIRG